MTPTSPARSTTSWPPARPRPACWRSGNLAHNLHLKRDLSAWQLGDEVWEWWIAGANAAEQLGERYAFLACAMGAAPAKGLGPPAPGTAEGSLPAGRVLVDPQVLWGTVARSDVTPGMSYLPIDPDHLDGSDGIVYLDTV